MLRHAREACQGSRPRGTTARRGAWRGWEGKRMSRWLWVVGLLALSVETVASAQTTPTETTPEVEESTQTPRDENLDQAARLTFQAAREAFGNGDYELALERFEQAYNL